MNLRMTGPRRAVLDVVRRSRDHPTASQIYERVHRDAPRIAHATVYNALHALTSHGLIVELKFGDGASRYDGRTEPHQHVSCIRCGAMTEIDLLLDGDWAAAASAQTGFAVQTYSIQFTGLCPRCRAEES